MPPTPDVQTIPPGETIDISVPMDADEYLCEFREFIDVLESGHLESSVYAKNGAVHALWARVALYMQDWDAAIEHSSVLIDDNADVYRLADCNSSYNASTSLLQYLWQGDASYENIFKLGYTSTSYGSAIGAVFLNFTRDYYYYYPDFVPSQSALDLYQSADRRYSCYFSSLQTGYSHQLNWPLLVKYYGNVALRELNIYHVSMPKILRLSEQYLIRAEAWCRKGNYGKAGADLSTPPAAPHPKIRIFISIRLCKQS